MPGATALIRIFSAASSTSLLHNSEFRSLGRFRVRWRLPDDRLPVMQSQLGRRQHAEVGPGSIETVFDCAHTTGRLFGNAVACGGEIYRPHEHPNLICGSWTNFGGEVESQTCIGVPTDVRTPKDQLCSWFPHSNQANTTEVSRFGNGMSRPGRLSGWRRRSPAAPGEYLFDERGSPPECGFRRSVADQPEQRFAVFLGGTVVPPAKWGPAYRLERRSSSLKSRRVRQYLFLDAPGSVARFRRRKSGSN